MRRRRIAIVVCCVAVAVGVAGAVGPGLAAPLLARFLSRRLGTPVTLGWIAWNPFASRLTVHGIRVDAERGPPVARVRRAMVEMSPWRVLRGSYDVERVDLEGARLRLVERDGTWGLPLPPRAEAAAGGGETAPPPLVVVDEAEIRRGVVRLERAKRPPAVLRVRRGTLHGAFGPEGMHGAGGVEGRLEQGRIAVVGRIRSGGARRRLRIRTTTRELDLRRVAALVPMEGAPEVGGRATVHATFDEATHGGHRHAALAGRVEAVDLTLGAAGARGVRVERLRAPAFGVDLTRRRVSFGSVTVRGAEVWAHRTPDGVRVPGVPQPSAGADASPGWTVTASGLALARGAVHYADSEIESGVMSIALERVDVGEVGVSDVPVKMSLAGSLSSGGRITASGEVIREPLQLRADGQVEELELPPLLALTNAPLRLESGRLAGSFHVNRGGSGLDGTGTFVVTDVKSISPDAKRPEDVLAFKELRMSVAEARADPPAARLAEVRLEWPYVLVDRSPEALFPLSLVGAARLTRASAGERAPVAVPEIRIDSLAVHGARIDFRDATIEPPYWRALAQLDVTAKGIDVAAGRIAELVGHGLVDELSPLRFEGTVGTRTHIRASVERLALPSFNPYLSDAASSYTVASGLLSGETELTLDRTQLEVTNRIVLSRLGLSGGEERDFLQRQLGIPLTLAVALMKDYRGNIELGLPFGGDLRAPKFSLRSVVLQAVVRAIQGAVLSPLNALGRVIWKEGRIEQFDLEPIPFPPGERALDALGRERVTQISRVLATRPELGLRVRGVVAAADVQHLQDTSLLDALAGERSADRLREFLRARLTGGALPSLKDADRRRLDALQGALAFPAEALRTLATDRGAVASAACILDGQLDAKRVTTIPAEPLVPERLAPQPAAAVELREP